MALFDFFTFRRRLEIQGEMPWRALLKLQRAKISVYHVKKTQKNRLILLVNAKDIQKVFAIYPKMCYNNNTTSSYRVRDLGGTGLQSAVDFLKKRIAFVLGALLFCVGCLASEPYVFGVEIVGSQIYRREIYQLLEENGVYPFSKYDAKKQDVLTARLLALQGVEFCSVQKSGNRVIVDMRMSPFPKHKIEQGDMLSLREGTILSLAVLHGTPLKKVGDTVVIGEKIVGGYFLTSAGEYKGVEPIARVCVACTYAREVQATSEEEAFAQAYLEAVNGGEITVYEKAIEKTERGYLARLSYTVIQSVNL